MTRYLDGTPSGEEIGGSVEELFGKAASSAGAGVLNAVVPVDRTMEEGFRVLNWTQEKKVPPFSPRPCRH